MRSNIRQKRLFENMKIECHHINNELSPAKKIILLNRLNNLYSDFNEILENELACGNVISDARAADDAVSLTVLLRNQFQRNYKSETLETFIEKDTHDHGIYYVTKKRPQQAIIAPYYK